MSVVAVSKVLRERLTDEGVDEFIKILSNVEEGARKDSLAILEERFERRLTEEISGVNLKIEGINQKIDGVKIEIESLRSEVNGKIDSLRSDMNGKIDSLRSEMNGKFASMRSEIRADMMSFKAEIIKWMFLFWIGQMVVMGGMMAALVKILK